MTDHLQSTESEEEMLRRAADEGRARYAAARDSSGESEPIGASSMADIIESSAWARSMAEWRRRDAEHRASCTDEICDRCERWGCMRCAKRRVKARDMMCWWCLLVEHLPSIGVPRRYVDACFGSAAIATLRARVRSPEAIELAGKTIRGGIVSMVYVGPAGAGKSTLAAAAAQQLMAYEVRRHPLRVPTIRWISAIDLGLARSRHRLGSEEEAELIVDACEADLLVLDDLGAEGARDHDAIAQVLHRRHDDNLATWVTTALTSAELAARYGGGLERRIVEGATIIHCAPRPTT